LFLPAAFVCHCAEIAAKPTVTRDGDTITISFESKGFCDATVAIENDSRRIIRHLASGVLGPKTPAPLFPAALYVDHQPLGVFHNRTTDYKERSA